MKTTTETPQQKEDRIIVDILHRDFYNIYEKIVNYIDIHEIEY